MTDYIIRGMMLVYKCGQAVVHYRSLVRTCKEILDLSGLNVTNIVDLVAGQDL